MDRSEIIEKLSDIFKMVMGDQALDLSTCDENSNLTEDLGLNSVGILYLVIAIEEFFHVRFEDVGAADVQTVGQVVDYIQKRVS